ncbi:MAG: hypothetical protein ACKVT1_18345 [Dehalococcoidia bacterium]
MAVARGLTLAFGAFAAAFALHIVGGASDQRWLFALAVALIYVTAVAFPTIAMVCAGEVRAGGRRALLSLGGVAGIGLTGAALWAANGRSFAWWTLPAALGMVVAVNVAVHYRFGRWLSRPAAVGVAP